MGNSGRFQKGDKTNLGRVPTEMNGKKKGEKYSKNTGGKCCFSMKRRSTNGMS